MSETRLFIGGLTRIDDKGRSTGIYKQPVGASIMLGPEGLAGDVQADRVDWLRANAETKGDNTAVFHVKQKPSAGA